ncbi:MAG: elongation factor P [Candidatus Nealsonbacteria bacterium]|nr:elongation factor P [Candidatus Nealsonbacteria bacterium]
MISSNDFEKGMRIVIDSIPYEIIETNNMFKGRGQSVLQTKLKNLKNGTVLSRTFRSSESFKEAEIDKMKAKFLYKNKSGYFFSKDNDPKQRFSLTEDQIGPVAKFLKEGETVEGIIFGEDIINIAPPIKVILKVTEAPPGVKGDRVQSGNKMVKIETGVEISAPLFIKEGDLIEVNTETEEYVRRIQ